MDDFYAEVFDWNEHVLATTSSFDIEAERAMMLEEKLEAEFEFQASVCDAIWGEDAWEEILQ